MSQMGSALIPGRTGYLTVRENTYAPITLSVECTLIPGANIDNVAKILKGAGKLILSDNETRYFDAEVVNSIPFERIFRHWNKFIIQFECQPFMKSIAEITKTLIVGNNIVAITGTATSIDGLQNSNSKMQRDFVSFKNGNNDVKVEKLSGTSTSIKVKYKDAWL